MSQFERDEGIEEYHIPVLKLPNARDILNEFNDSIQRITASGETMSKETIQNNDKYGFNVDETYSISANLHYVRRRNTNGETINPLTEENIKKINSEIHQYLSSTKTQERENITYDIPVTRLIVEVEDELLNWKYEEADSDTFYFDFQLERTENFSGDFKDMIEPLFKERNLTEQGFNWRVPVLRQIIPLGGFDVGGESHDPVFSWDPSNTNTKPMNTGGSLKVSGMLPDEIAYNKAVQKTDNEYWSI